MSKVIAGMAISLDGFVNDKKGSVDQLYTDFQELHHVPSFQQMIRETGAVVMGRNVYEMADPFSWVNDEYEFQVPLFIVTHHPPENFPPGNDKLSVTFVTDGVASAVAQAKQAAGERDIQVLGASTIQQCLKTGLCDELLIDIMPVLLGEGVRLFEHIPTIQLERVKIEQPTKARTTMTFRVLK